VAGIRAGFRMAESALKDGRYSVNIRDQVRWHSLGGQEGWTPEESHQERGDERASRQGSHRRPGRATSSCPGI